MLFLAAFGIFGTWMIQRTFEKSYQRVLEDGERDNRMYQLSFELNLNMLDEAYRNEEMIAATASTFIQNLSDANSIYRIYNSAQTLLYENHMLSVRDVTILDFLSAENPCCYELLRLGNQTWLLFACISEVGGQTYYLQNLKNISSIYTERENYYDWYTVMMLIVTAVTTILVFVVTHFLTHSIAQLSQTTRRFTRGDLEVRAVEDGGDEIAELADGVREDAGAAGDLHHRHGLHGQQSQRAQNGSRGLYPEAVRDRGTAGAGGDGAAPLQ